ncbi:MAG: hypothetical protein U0T69_01215 [Chitinophagales bacterium]
MKKSISRRKFLGLSVMAGVAASVPLTSCKKETIQSNENDIEAIVIGSGFGASVSALRLTEAGKKTLMLEMGKQYAVNPSGNVFSETLNLTDVLRS